MSTLRTPHPLVKANPPTHPVPEPGPPAELLTNLEVAKRLRVCKRTWERIKHRLGIRPVLSTPRTQRFIWSEVLQAMRGPVGFSLPLLAVVRKPEGGA